MLFMQMHDEMCVCEELNCVFVFVRVCVITTGMCCENYVCELSESLNPRRWDTDTCWRPPGQAKTQTQAEGFFEALVAEDEHSLRFVTLKPFWQLRKQK